ncbi:hypothetical protein ACSBR2_030025 [Camellia fascicularis]
MPEESINSSIGLDIESLSAEIQTNCQNLETKHGVKQWPYRPVYCMRKEDLLPTLHFSGLRSLHCINKRSLLCISLVEGTL